MGLGWLRSRVDPAKTWIEDKKEEEGEERRDQTNELKFIEFVSYENLPPANSFRVGWRLLFFRKCTWVLPIDEEDVNHHLFDKRVEERKNPEKEEYSE